MYYTQCQVQMYSAGLSTCDLFIWSPVENGSICVQVNRDDSFLKNVILICEEFYFFHYLPALYDTFISKIDVRIRLNEIKQESVCSIIKENQKN